MRPDKNDRTGATAPTYLAPRRRRSHDHTARPVLTDRPNAATMLVCAYLLAAISLTILLTVVLDAGLPVFTLIWLLVAGVVLLRHGTDRLGLRSVSRRTFLSMTGICLLGVAGPALILEPLTKSYTGVIEAALDEPTVDLAFAGLADSPTGGALVTVAYLGAIGFVAEELFFRGVLVQSFRARLGRSVIVWQALGFVLLNSFVLIVAPLGDGIVYLVGYTVPLALVLGWAAYRTGSIWPGLVALNIANAAYFLIAWDFLAG